MHVGEIMLVVMVGILASLVLGLIGKGVLRISSLDPLRFELVSDGGELSRYERELLKMKGGDFDLSGAANSLRAVEKGVILKMRGFSFGRTIERYREVFGSGEGVVDPDLRERMAELGGGTRRTVESILQWAEERVKTMPAETAHPRLRRGIDLGGKEEPAPRRRGISCDVGRLGVGRVRPQHPRLPQEKEGEEV